MREGESALEARLRSLRQETQKFNQDWWTKHNREFKQGRENFIKNILETKYPDEPDKSTLSADEMSQFYRFLPFKTPCFNIPLIIFSSYIS